MMDGKECYKIAEKATDPKKNMGNTFAVTIRSLPFASACIEIYSRLLVAHFGSLAKGAMLNGHELGSIKTENTDGSLTIVLNDERGAPTAPKLPFLVNGIAFGDVRWDKSQATISGYKVCQDKRCRGFDGYHVEGCERKAIVSKAQINTNVAILKSFQRVMLTS